MRSEQRPRAKEVARFVELLEEIAAYFGGRYGLSEREKRVLDAVAEGRARSVADLAAETGLHRVRVSELLGKLERLRLIARVRDAEDLRRFVIELTSQGARAQKAPVRFEEEAVRAALWEIDCGARYRMKRFLESIRADALRVPARSGE